MLCKGAGANKSGHWRHMLPWHLLIESGKLCTWSCRHVSSSLRTDLNTKWKQVHADNFTLLHTWDKNQSAIAHLFLSEPCKTFQKMFFLCVLHVSLTLWEAVLHTAFRPYCNELPRRLVGIINKMKADRSCVFIPLRESKSNFKVIGNLLINNINWKINEWLIDDGFQL